MAKVKLAPSDELIVWAAGSASLEELIATRNKLTAIIQKRNAQRLTRQRRKPVTVEQPVEQTA